MTTRSFSRPLLAAALCGALTIGLTGATATATPESFEGAGARGDGASGIGDPYWPLDGNGGIDVASYAISNRYAFDTKRLSGRTKVRLTATADLSSFSLDFLLRVSEVTVDGAEADFTRTDGGHELRITPATPLAAGTEHTVVVAYADRPARRSYAGESNWLASKREVVTMNEPHMAPWWFPANDHPSDKAAMDVRITVPRGFKVLSNGLPVGRRVRGAVATSHGSPSWLPLAMSNRPAAKNAR